MNEQNYLGYYAVLYFCVIPAFFAIMLASGLISELYREYKKRKKLKEILSKYEND